MSKIKLIASDLDGTLLINHATSCNPTLFPLIRELVSRGIYFVPASGRQYVSLQKLFAPVKEEIMYLCENGALVMHTNQVLFKNQFSDGLAMEICHRVLEHPDCEIVISGERTCYLIPKEPWFVPYIRDDIGNKVTVVDSPEWIEEPILKVSYYTAPENRDKVTAEFSKYFTEDSCQIVTSGHQWVDIMPVGTNKGSALAAIGEQLGILPEEMAAFGDNENDREMLSFVGHPYLMEQCNPTMEDMKVFRCKNVEDSLKQILKELDA